VKAAKTGAPHHPKAFGEELQRLREGAGLRIEDIASETKISRSVLRSLEGGDFRYLPQQVFSRNFVIQIATVVGADPDHLADAFDGAWEHFALASGAHLKLESDEAPFVGAIRWRFWLPVMIAAGILIISGLVILRSSAPEVQFAGEKGAQPRVRQDENVSPSVPSLLPTATEVALGRERVSILIRVRPDMECWIHYRDGDGVAGGRLLAGGAAERIELTGPVKLTVGDADAVIVEVAGVEYEGLGRSGQVVHTEVSSEGLVVLGPRVRND
jgi:transcriptional regulator with XRE-family HTH domain